MSICGFDFAGGKLPKPMEPWRKCRRCGALLNPMHNVGRLCYDCIRYLSGRTRGGF